MSPVPAEAGGTLAITPAKSTAGTTPQADFVNHIIDLSSLAEVSHREALIGMLLGNTSSPGAVQAMHLGAGSPSGGCREPSLATGLTRPRLRSSGDSVSSHREA